jgi:hypothetical protein
MTGLEELQKHDSEGDRNIELGQEVTRRTNKKEREERVHVTPTTSIGYMAHPEKRTRELGTRHTHREHWIHGTPKRAKNEEQ